MQKVVQLPRLGRFIHQRLFLRMCGVLIFTLLLSFQAMSQDFQTSKVNLDVKGVSLKEALAEVQKQSGIRFVYDQDINKYATLKITLSQKGLSVKRATELILSNTNLQYILEGSHIMISEKAPKVKPQRPGKISGKVADDKGEALPGASIRIVELNSGITSSVDGSYVLNVQPGTYTLELSYVSFQTQRITNVVIQEDKSTLLNVVMKRGGGTLNEVTVTATYQRASVEGLYARQKNSAGITDGISAEQIARTPDKNIGESLKRISGLSSLDNKYVVVRGMSERYNQAMLNGQVMPSTELNRKNFSYDIIPANMVDNVVVAKTVTPDQSAEFGGGLVQVNTKDIPTENFLNIAAGITYNDHTTGKNFRTLQLEGKEYLGSISDHRKLFGRDDWGSRAAAEAYFNEHDKNPMLFNNNWKVYQLNALPSQNYQISAGRVIPLKNENKLGIIASVSYRNTFQTQDVITERGGFSANAGNNQSGLIGKQYGFTTNAGALLGIGFSNSKHKIGFQSFYTRVLDQQLTSGLGRRDDNISENLSLGFFDNTQQSSLLQSQLKGEHLIGKKGIKINWQGSFIDLNRQRPDNHILWGQVMDRRDSTPVDLPHDDYNIITPGGPGGSTSAPGINGVTRSWNSVKEQNYSWDAAITLPFNLGIARNSFKAGTAGWYKKRRFYVINAISGANSLESYPSTGELFTPEYAVNTVLNPFGDDAETSIPLVAAYGMLDNKIGKNWRLVWGVRAEHFDMDRVNEQIRAVERDFPGRDASALYNLEKKWQLFPSANLTYSLTPKMNLRLAYSKSIIRPDLRDLSFFYEYDFEMGGTYRGGRVRSTILHNYDFRYEWYLGAGELISVSLFYKDFRYPMEVTQEPNSAVFVLKNNYSAKNYGLEMEFRKKLSFINLPVIKNITLYGNFTMMDASVRQMTEKSSGSDGTIILTQEIMPEEKRPLAGQSNYMYNAGVYYDSRYIGASLSYNYITNRLYRPTETYYQSLFERPVKALDLQLTSKFFKQRLEVRINMSNLLNSYNVVYSKTKIDVEKALANKLPHSAYFYNPKEDAINYKASPGSSYGLTLSYNF